MTDHNEQVPEYIKNLPPPSEDEFWKHIQDRFQELWMPLYELRLETKDEAVKKNIGNEFTNVGVYWIDPEVSEDLGDLEGGEQKNRIKQNRVRAWNQIPYNPFRDEEYFYKHWQVAKQLAEIIAPKIKARVATPQFLFEWGAFCEHAAVIYYASLDERPDLTYLTIKAKRSKDCQKRYFAKLFIFLQKPGASQNDTLLLVMGYLQDKIEENEFPDPRYNREWYESFFGPSGDLTKSFQPSGGIDVGLSLSQLEELAAIEDDDLPSIDI